MTIETLQKASQVKAFIHTGNSLRYDTGTQWNGTEYDYNVAAEREAASQKAYNARLRSCHAAQEAHTGFSGVSPWNQIEDADQLDPEVLAILKADPDAMSAAERDGFEFTGFDLLDSEIATLDQEIGSYAIKGEAAWSAKSESQTPEMIDEYTELHNQRDVDDFDTVTVTVYAPEQVDIGGRFVPEAFERKERKLTKVRRFHDIEFVLDTMGRVRSKLTSDVSGKGQSKEDMRAEALAQIEAKRLKKIARLNKRFGK